jgi:hypothetical protein
LALDFGASESVASIAASGAEDGIGAVQQLQQEVVPEEDFEDVIEICDNELDDDGDGLVDTEDTEECPTAEEQ